MKQVTSATKNIAEAADETSKTLRVVREGFAQTQASIDETLAIVRRPLKDVDPKAVAQTVTAIRNAATSLDARLSSREAGQAIASLGDPVNHVNHLVPSVDLVVRAGREDLTATLSYLRQASENLREVSRVLALSGRQDLPQEAVFSSPDRGSCGTPLRIRRR